MDSYFEIKKLIVNLFELDQLESEFLSSYDFCKFIEKLDIGYFDESHINDLWMSKILNADLIQSTNELIYEGLILVCQRSDLYFYLDQRTISSNYSLGSGLEKFTHDFKDVKLYFHKYRIFSILYILNISKIDYLHKLQFLINKEQVINILQYELDNKSTSSMHSSFIKESSYRDNIIALAIASNLHANSDLFIRLVKKIDIQDIEQATQKLCCISEILDPNPMLHLIIRFTHKTFRKSLGGNIGVSMLLFEMAESIRRVAECAHEKELKEEVENGFHFWEKKYKESFFGQDRLYDNNSVAKEIFKTLGADYSIKIRCYVEGETEEGFLNSLLNYATCEVINLKGKINESRNTYNIIDYFKRDLKDKVFSLVFIDKDRKDNVRLLERACKNNNFFGQILYSDPDFEFSNFTKEELKRIIIEHVHEQGFEEGEICRFEASYKSINKAKDLENLVKETFTHSNTFCKGENWGMLLAKYLSQTSEYLENKKPRDVINVLNFIQEVVSDNLLYVNTQQKYKVCHHSGKLVLKDE